MPDSEAVPRIHQACATPATVLFDLLSNDKLDRPGTRWEGKRGAPRRPTRHETHRVMFETLARKSCSCRDSPKIQAAPIFWVHEQRCVPRSRRPTDRVA